MRERENYYMGLSRSVWNTKKNEKEEILTQTGYNIIHTSAVKTFFLYKLTSKEIEKKKKIKIILIYNTTRTRLGQV